jgi:hypothetical protein
VADLQQSNVRLSLPRGWEGAIVGRARIDAPAGSVGAAALGAASVDGTDTGAAATAGIPQLAAAAGAEPLATLHVANFPLPPARGDYGSGAVEAMPFDGVFVALLEFAPDSRSSVLFSHEGVPLPLDPAAFSPRQLQRPQRSQAGLQLFFTANGRPFCLYVVIGDLNQRAGLVAQANALLAGLDIG